MRLLKVVLDQNRVTPRGRDQHARLAKTTAVTILSAADATTEARTVRLDNLLAHAQYLHHFAVVPTRGEPSRLHLSVLRDFHQMTRRLVLLDF